MKKLEKTMIIEKQKLMLDIHIAAKRRILFVKRQEILRPPRRPQDDTIICLERQRLISVPAIPNIFPR